MWVLNEPNCFGGTYVWYLPKLFVSLNYMSCQAWFLFFVCINAFLLIPMQDRTLTLISPTRALAVRDSMFFEFHLKIKGGDAADEDFNKGFIEHSDIRHTQQPTIRSLESCLSRMELVYTPVRCALEASIAVSILKGPLISPAK